MIPRYQKILQVGHRTIKDLFLGPVEVTEKLDGSQFRFTIGDDKELLCGTKKTTIHGEPDKLFGAAVEHIKSVQHLLDPNLVYFGETLWRPHHNVLSYNSTPKHNIALFAVGDKTSKVFYRYDTLSIFASALDIDVVPLLYQGYLNGVDDVLNFLKTESYLGGPCIEGMVFKNYTHDNMIGEQYLPYLVGKYVSEKFKEKHTGKAYGEQKNKETWDTFKKSYNTEARWLKAVGHLRDESKLVGEPKDIGPLIQEVKSDIIEEEENVIKAFLWKKFGKELLAESIRGLPEWYKEELMRGNINV